MLSALTVFCLVTVATLLHVGAMATIGLAFRLHLSEFSLFIGPVVARFWLGDTAVSLRAIPVGGYARFEGLEPEASAETTVTDAAAPFHPLLRAVMELSGCALLFGFSAIVLGPRSAVEAVLRGFTQLLAPLLAPSEAVQSVLTAAEVVRSSTTIVLLALVASKVAAFNLLPIPMLNGGQALTDVVRWLFPLSLRARTRLLQIGFVLLVLIASLWLITLLRVAGGALPSPPRA